jgi:hypothetical protein
VEFLAKECGEEFAGSFTCQAAAILLASEDGPFHGLTDTEIKLVEGGGK